MTNDSNFGVLLACLCCLVPWAIGFMMAWALRLRVHQRGWRGALVPKKLKDRIDNFFIHLEDFEE